MASCGVCGGEAVLWRVVDGYDYFDCGVCGSIAIDAASLDQIDSGNFPRHYDPDYWAMEARDARDRSFGSSLARVAESFLYARRPIDRYVDIGSGPGFLLDALSIYLPAASQLFFGVEKFPPAEHSTHPGYIVGDLADEAGVFDAGVCVEVVEHLTPTMFRQVATAMAKCSAPGSLYYFNTGMPEYVKNEDQGYMDPLRRGHIVSWGWEALRMIFEPLGFTVFPVQRKTFAFVVEFQSSDQTAMADRIWTPHPQNRAALTDPQMGSVMFALGLESARAYA